MNTRRSSAASPAAPSALLGDIRALIEAARKRAASTVNSELTMLYWSIGQRIHTQVLDGRRGAYGKEVLPTLAAQLVKEYGNSFAEQNLRRMVQFAVTFPDEQILVSLIREFVYSALIAPLTNITIVLPIECQPPITFMQRVTINPILRAKVIDIFIGSWILALRVPALLFDYFGSTNVEVLPNRHACCLLEAVRNGFLSGHRDICSRGNRSLFCLINFFSEFI